MAAASSSDTLTTSDGMAAKAPNVLPSWLLIGDKAMAKDLQSLRARKVRYIVNCSPPLTEGGVANFFATDASLEYLRVPLRDVATESIVPHVAALTEFLQRARVRADGRALVHCNEGRSRSAVMLSVFLTQAYGWSADDALAAVRAARPCAAPRDNFVKQLHGLVPSTLASEVDGFVEATPTARSIGPAVGPAPRPSVGAAPRPNVGPAPRPSVGPTPRPLVGPAPPPRDTHQRPSDDDDVGAGAAAGEDEAPAASKRSAPIGPEPPPKRSAAIGPSLGPTARPT